MPINYYIDGYNVVHCCSRLRALIQDSFEAGRDALVDRVSRYCAATGEAAMVVFDGRGRAAEPMPPFHGSPGLEVVYSPTHQSADALIERAVYDAKNRRDIIVVSGDRGIRDLCRGLGALVMSPDNFLVAVDERLERDRAGLHAQQNPQTRSTIEDRLDPSARDQLEALKKRLEE